MFGAAGRRVGAVVLVPARRSAAPCTPSCRPGTVKRALPDVVGRVVGRAAWRRSRAPSRPGSRAPTAGCPAIVDGASAPACADGERDGMASSSTGARCGDERTYRSLSLTLPPSASDGSSGGQTVETAVAPSRRTARSRRGGRSPCGGSASGRGRRGRAASRRRRAAASAPAPCRTANATLTGGALRHVAGSAHELGQVVGADLQHRRGRRGAPGASRVRPAAAARRERRHRERQRAAAPLARAGRRRAAPSRRRRASPSATVDARRRRRRR